MAVESWPKFVDSTTKSQKSQPPITRVERGTDLPLGRETSRVGRAL